MRVGMDEEKVDGMQRPFPLFFFALLMQQTREAAMALPSPTATTPPALKANKGAEDAQPQALFLLLPVMFVLSCLTARAIALGRPFAEVIRVSV